MALAAAAEQLGRRARARRALLALGRAAEESAAERDRVRPRLREAFLAWDQACGDGLKKREQRAEEARERDRWELGCLIDGRARGVFFFCPDGAMCRGEVQCTSILRLLVGLVGIGRLLCVR